MPSITVDDKPQEEVKKEAPVGEKQYVTLDDLEKIRQENEVLKRQLNGISYSLRKVDDISRKLDSFSQPAPVASPALPKDEWEVKLEKDWKGTVEELADRRAESKYQEFRKKEREEDAKKAEEHRTMTTLQKSQQEVIARYSDLNDPNSELSARFLKVLDRHPEYKTNEYGPVLTMRDMEDELRSEGKLDDFSKKVVEKEVARQTRVGATSVPAGRASSPQGNSLTRDQKEFCDANGINYDVYLRNIKSMQRKSEE